MEDFLTARGISENNGPIELYRSFLLLFRLVVLDDLADFFEFVAAVPSSNPPGLFLYHIEV